MKNDRTKVDALKDLGEKVTGATLTPSENETVVGIIDKIADNYSGGGTSGGSKIFYINQALASENWEENKTLSAYILKDTATEVKQELDRVATALRQELYVPIGRKSSDKTPSIIILSTWDIMYADIEDDNGKMKRITFINTISGEGETNQYIIMYIEETEVMPELNGKWIAYAVME